MRFAKTSIVEIKQKLVSAVKHRLKFANNTNSNFELEVVENMDGVHPEITISLKEVDP